MKHLNTSLGSVIRELRVAAGISQEELAERAAIHRTYVSQLERGLKSPTVQMLAKIAGCLGTTASRILKRAEEVQQLSRC